MHVNLSLITLKFKNLFIHENYYNFWKVVQKFILSLFIF